MPDRAMPAATTAVTGPVWSDLGLGLGASALVGGKRFQVTADLNRYLTFTKEELAAGAQYEEIHELSRQERMEEFMFLGLRLTGGVRTAEFERRFGVTMEAVYGEVIERLLKEGLLEASAQTDSHGPPDRIWFGCQYLCTGGVFAIRIEMYAQSAF